jgi:isopropylmalate/homocitrate/citramalate synthase
MNKLFSYSNKLMTRTNIMQKINLFDVSLRDGLQGLTIEEQLSYKPIDIINLYYNIKEKYNPKQMEIGSIVSNKLLPIFHNSDSLYNYVEYCQLEPSEQKIKHYILIPNENKFEYVDKFIGLNNISFISSVSESFQHKNTKLSLSDNYQQIYNMVQKINKSNASHSIKLYISCINECPIEGKIDNNVIVEKIIKYQELKPDILCLSDTCGTLTNEDFKYIISCLKDNKINNNISLHLHVKPGRENEVEKIIHTALDYEIYNFDVSALNTGGCSVTIKKNELVSNLSYELFYKCLSTYIFMQK